MRQAELSPIQEKILDLKIQKRKNQEIAAIVNKEFGKSYTTNYISTIFRQKILPAINDAAAYHEKLLGSVFFEEEFKTCTGCGRTLLRDTENFTRKTRSLRAGTLNWFNTIKENPYICENFIKRKYFIIRE